MLEPETLKSKKNVSNFLLQTQLVRKQYMVLLFTKTDPKRMNFV